MKNSIKNYLVMVLCVFANFANAQVVSSSYAGVIPFAESEIARHDNLYQVTPDAVAGLNKIYFSTIVSFPSGTTSATITGISFTASNRIRGVNRTFLTNQSMMSSSFVSSGTSSPYLYAKDAVGIMSMFGNIGNNPILNPKSFQIINQEIPLGSVYLPKLVQEGDFYKIVRDMSIRLIVNGISQDATLQTTGTIIAGPESKITGFSSGQAEGNTVNILYIQGLNPKSRGISWFLETSTDLVSWSDVTTGQLTIDSITILANSPAEPRRFWRVKTIK